MNKKISAIVREQIIFPVTNFNRIQLEQHSTFLDIIEEFENVINSLKKKDLKIASGDEVKSDSVISIETCDNVSGPSQKNQRGRPRKNKEADNAVEKPDETNSDDVPSSSRSQRAAAQAAGHKLAQVQSLMKATKLRRPTDFDEKQITWNKGSSPPPKSRKTHRKQSAGSCNSQDADETNDHDNKENNVLTEDVFNPLEISGTENNGTNLFTESEAHVNDEGEKNGKNNSECPDICSKECSVQLEKLTESAIKTLSRDEALKKPLRKRKSTDFFEDSIPLANLLNNNTENETDNPLRNKELSECYHKSNNKKIKNEKLAKSVGDLCHINEADAVTSTLGNQSPFSDDQFKGFDQKDIIKKNILRNNIILKEVHSDSEVLNIKRNEAKQQVFRKTIFISKKEDITDIEQIEIVTKNTKTEVLRKKNQDKAKDVNLSKHVLKSEIVVDNIMSNNKDISKTNENITKQHLKSQPKRNGVETNLGVCNETVTIKSDSENESPEIILRSRTRVIKKNTEIEVPNDGCRTRTKTLRKGPQSNDECNIKPPTVNPIELALNEQNKKVGIEVYTSPVQNKGELVKKRIEDFERMKSELGSVKEETTGRRYRQTARNRIAPSSETQPSRVKNAKVLPKSTERTRMTPLGTQNRMTPAGDSKLLVVNKGLNSATRQIPNENNTAFVQRQIVEEIEKKKKEDERLKRHAKEETAKKKKEKTLKNTAEETRRKREEKLQKVAAAREAAEKEKHLIALKLEKDKEEKLQHIAAEKEKQREEQLKKKQLALQKALQHEERRKQEEAARLAKLREQEEEHKRILATKERELELQKQQKTADLRLAETEKAKYLQQGGKLGKLAAVNNANMKLQQGMTPAIPPNESYEITPAREDRPLIEPKSENDYGIDDANSGDSSDEECKPKKKIPLWAQPKNRHTRLVINNLLPREIWSLFMECNAKPDINEIFAGNPLKKRTRTSSAVWNTPPRYSHFKY